MRSSCFHELHPTLKQLALDYHHLLSFQIHDPRKLADLVEDLIKKAYAAILTKESDLCLHSVSVDTARLNEGTDAVELTWGYTGALFDMRSATPVKGTFVGHRYGKDHYVKSLTATHLAILTVQDKTVDACVTCLDDVGANHPYEWVVDRTRLLGQLE